MTEGPALDPEAFRAPAHRAADLGADHLDQVPGILVAEVRRLGALLKETV